MVDIIKWISIAVWENEYTLFFSINVLCTYSYRGIRIYLTSIHFHLNICFCYWIFYNLTFPQYSSFFSVVSIIFVLYQCPLGTNVAFVHQYLVLDVFFFFLFCCCYLYSMNVNLLCVTFWTIGFVNTWKSHWKIKFMVSLFFLIALYI